MSNWESVYLTINTLKYQNDGYKKIEEYIFLMTKIECKTSWET